MYLRLQHLIVVSASEPRTLTVQTTHGWKVVLATVSVASVVYGATRGAPGLAVAAAIVVISTLMAFFSNSLIIDTEAKHLVLWSGIGPVRGKSTIPFETFSFVTISDGGAAVHSGTSSLGMYVRQRPIYSLASRYFFTNMICASKK